MATAVTRSNKWPCSFQNTYNLGSFIQPKRRNWATTVLVSINNKVWGDRFHVFHWCAKASGDPDRHDSAVNHPLELLFYTSKKSDLKGLVVFSKVTLEDSTRGKLSSSKKQLSCLQNYQSQPKVPTPAARGPELRCFCVSRTWEWLVWNDREPKGHIALALRATLNLILLPQAQVQRAVGICTEQRAAKPRELLSTSGWWSWHSVGLSHISWSLLRDGASQETSTCHPCF